MTNRAKFHNELVSWLARNGFSNCDVNFSEDFYYTRNIHTISIGASYPHNGSVFEQFLSEYGLEVYDIWTPILCFLHEACHHITLPNFNEEELNILRLVKSDDNITDFEYWEVPDEFAANMVLIDFVNENYDAIIELTNIFIENITKIQSEGETLWDFIEEAV